MSGDNSSAGASRRETRWVQSGLGGSWWWAAILIPLLLAAFVVWQDAEDIEATLIDDVTAALADKGVSDAEVEADGRDISVVLPPEVPGDFDAYQAQALLEDLDGVRTASVTGGPGYISCLRLQGQVNEILGPNKVAFPAGANRPGGAELSQVQQAANLLASCGTPVRVTAFTDNSVGQRLANQRAQFVTRTLDQGGVSVTATRVGGGAQVAHVAIQVEEN